MIYITQEEINQHIETLQTQIQKFILEKDIRFRSIIGVANGGLNISRPISQNLKIPHAELRVSWYDGQTKRQEPLVDIIDCIVLEHYCGNLLLIDDLTDTGDTLITIKNHPKLQDKTFYTAVLYHNFSAKIMPDFYVVEKPHDWLVFPWNDT